jgi:RNA polymerase sigma factor (sigma-70 family)
MAAQEHADLVARTARGDRAAWGGLYRTYLPLVLRWCVRATGDRELAADLSSEVFAEALLAARRYRPEAGPVGAWLIGIAHNKLRETRRRRRVEDSARRKLGIERDTISDLDLERVDELVSSDSRLEGLLADLPVEHRRALVARVIEERPYEEIAAVLDCTEAVVRQRVSRGLKTLRTQLESR